MVKCGLCDFKCQTGRCIDSHVKMEHSGQVNPGYSIDIESPEARVSQRDEKHSVRSKNCNVKKEIPTKSITLPNRSIESQRKKAKKAIQSKVRRRIIDTDSDTDDEVTEEATKSTPKHTLDSNIEATVETTKVVTDSETIPKKVIKLSLIHI